MTASGRNKLIAGYTLLGILAMGYWLLRDSTFVAALLDDTMLRERIAALGLWGPATIIALMALAILVSPLPSAPIAVAAGALYGHFWGTVYVLFGAQIGAVAAFSVSRFLGYDVLHRWFRGRLAAGWLGSQNKLMGIVLVSRLIPFISFDLMSYAAGLTVLSFWRFAIATAVGIVPASFVLAHFGDEMATGETNKIMLSVLVLGVLTSVPLLTKVFRERNERQTQDDQH